MASAAAAANTGAHSTCLFSCQKDECVSAERFWAELSLEEQALQLGAPQPCRTVDLQESSCDVFSSTSEVTATWGSTFLHLDAELENLKVRWRLLLLFAPLGALATPSGRRLV